MEWVVKARPCLYTAGKEILYQLYRGLGVPRGRSARVPKISPPTGVLSWTVQPIASRYTYWAIPAAYVAEVNRTSIMSFTVHRVPPMWWNKHNIVCRGGVWGWQVGRPPRAPLLRGPRTSDLWVCQAIFSGKLEILIYAPFKILLQVQIP